jgi:hypothetical protein
MGNFGFWVAALLFDTRDVWITKHSLLDRLFAVLMWLQADTETCTVYYQIVFVSAGFISDRLIAQTSYPATSLRLHCWKCVKVLCTQFTEPSGICEFFSRKHMFMIGYVAFVYFDFDKRSFALSVMNRKLRRSMLQLILGFFRRRLLERTSKEAHRVKPA